jgi:hypothetical protein
VGFCQVVKRYVKASVPFQDPSRLAALYQGLVRRTKPWRGVSCLAAHCEALARNLLPCRALRSLAALCQALPRRAKLCRGYFILCCSRASAARLLLLHSMKKMGKTTDKKLRLQDKPDVKQF